MRSAAHRSVRVGLVGLVALAILSIPGIAAAVPPTNDNFANRVTIPTLPFTDTKITTEATTEPGEQEPDCAPIGRTVWYQFTPGSNTILRADTIGSDFDTVIGAWTGTTLPILTEVACDDDSGPGVQSDLVFQAAAGTTYLFQVGGFGGESGNLNFRLSVGGGISGTVTAEGGGPLQDICVEVYDATTGDFVRFATTNASGQYSVLVGTGSYKVFFYDDCDPARSYISEWYNNKPDEPSADPVTVTAGNITTGIDAALALGASISGTVTAQESGSPLADICVEVYDATTLVSAGFAETNASGQYAVGGLPTGSYKVEFYDFCDAATDRIGEWYNDKATEATADPVAATAPNATTGINAGLALGGSISGTVTGEGGGAPLPDICVEVVQATSGSFVSFAETNASGQYTAGGLSTGSYKVEFSDLCDGQDNYATEWYDNKADFSTADAVSVTQGSNTPNINAALALRPNNFTLSVSKVGTGSGTVTSSPEGINCGPDCSEVYNQNTVVTLTAAAASGSVFAGWSGGGCSGTGTCQVTMDSDKTVTATFNTAPVMRTLNVTKPGTGTGTVSSAPPGINCGPDCSESYADGTSVNLTAAPATGSVFAGWGGDGASCGAATSCTVNMNADKTVTATFNTAPVVPPPPGGAQPKSVSLKAKPKKVEEGRKTKLTAVVAPCAGHEGDLLEFYRGSKKIASKASDGTCVAKLAVKMKKSATFKAVSPQQDADHLAGTSNAVKVKVT